MYAPHATGAFAYNSFELDGVSKLSVSDSGLSAGNIGLAIGSSRGTTSHRADNFSASFQ